jgi:hypothetical protein
MDIVDAVYQHVPRPITIRRVNGHEWMDIALPISINLSKLGNAARTT